MMLKFSNTTFWQNYESFDAQVGSSRMRCSTDAVLLYDLFLNFKFKNYLEIGIHQGLTSGLVYESNPGINITGIDIKLQLELFASLYPACKRVNYLHDSTTFDFTQLGKFDLILIDGDHTSEFVLSDIKNCVPMLEDTGVLILDDWELPDVYMSRETLYNLGLQPFLRLQQCELWHKGNNDRSEYLDGLFSSKLANFLTIDTLTEHHIEIVTVKGLYCFNEELPLARQILSYYDL